MANRAEEALHPDYERFVVVTDVTGIAAMADEVTAGSTPWTTLRLGEGEKAKSCSILLDI
jgi:hypothetical protein